MANRADDRLSQAESDLQAAGALRQADRHEWACFACHQAAEKAVKAILFARGDNAWGHGIKVLLGHITQAPLPSPEWLNFASQLDGYYIPTRYPDSFPAGAPGGQFTVLQSQRAIDYAGAILRYARDAVAAARGGAAGGG